MADDFCSAATSQSSGILRGAAYWYANWSGRFSAHVLDSLFGYFGPAATPYATALVLITWFAVLAYAVNLATRLLYGRSFVWFSILAAAVVLFVVLEITPSVAQSVYWGQGLRSVVPPLILATALQALAEKSLLVAKVRSSWIAGAIVLTFIAGGFSETYVTLQTVALIIIVCGNYVRHRQQKRTLNFPLLAGALMGSLIAIITVMAAPGNAFRRTPFPPPPGLMRLFSISLAGLLAFFNSILGTPTKRLALLGLALFSLVVGAYLFPHERRVNTSRLILAWLPVIGFILLFSCHIPIAYGASLNLPDRTLIIPTYVLVILVMAWFYLWGGELQSVVRKRWTMPVAVAVLFALGALAVYAGAKHASLAPVFREYAKAWKARESLIHTAKARGEDFVQVPRLHNSAGLDEIEPDPKILWLTKCVQDYYGIGVLTDYDGAPDPKAHYHQQQVESAAEAIKPLPNSSLARLNALAKPGRGVVNFYISDAGYDDIKAHYESELIRNGWKKFGERKLEIFQKYNGEMHALFCKGNYAANLFYTGPQAQRLGYNYSLALNWGVSSGFVWGSDDCIGQ